jgi:hypothetical protein
MNWDGLLVDGWWHAEKSKPYPNSVAHRAKQPYRTEAARATAHGNRQPSQSV